MKYEQNNPTVSARVSLEIHKKLQEVRQLEGLSFADILKIGLGIVEPKVKEHETVRSTAHAKGWSQGHRDAAEKYRVTFRCRGCKKVIEVNDQKMREAAGKYMEEHGWGHTKCFH